MDIVFIKKENIHLLENFLLNIGEASKTFRYFDKRSIDDIRNHIVTLLLVDNKTPVAYGHLEDADQTIWLGICVLPKYSRNGYGKIMMQALIEEAKNAHFKNITLTVDKLNLPAIALYESFDFDKVNESETYYTYIYKITYPEL